MVGKAPTIDLKSLHTETHTHKYKHTHTHAFGGNSLLVFQQAGHICSLSESLSCIGSVLAI